MPYNIPHAYPDEQSGAWWDTFDNLVAATYAEAGRPLPVGFDFRPFRWWTRPAYSIGSGVAAHDARTKHLRELEAELHIGELPVDGGLPVDGYPDEGIDGTVKSWWNDQRDAIKARYDAAKRPFVAGYDFDLFKWAARTAYDIGNGMSPEAAQAKHIYELRQSLGLGSNVPQVVRPLVGRLRIENKLFCDDTGNRRVLFASWFPALRILRDNPQEFERQLDAIVNAGYQGFRTFLAVGGWSDFWDGREVAPIGFTKWFYTGNLMRTDRYGAFIPAWNDYDSLLRRLLRACRDRGLRLHLSMGDLQIIAPSASVELSLHQYIARICAEEGGSDVIALVESTNEYPINRLGSDSGDSIKQMGRVLKVWKDALPGVLTAQGACLSEEVDKLVESVTYGDLCVSHTSRDPFELCLKRTLGLVYWEGNYRAFPYPFWQGEPAGPGKDSFAAQNDPANLVALYAMHALTGQSSNWFQGAAVRSRVPLESEWGFLEMPTILSVIPEDIAAWQHGSDRHGGAEYWFSGKQFFTVAFKEWNMTPPQPIKSWTLYSGNATTSGVGFLHGVTGLLVGEFA